MNSILLPAVLLAVLFGTRIRSTCRPVRIRLNIAAALCVAGTILKFALFFLFFDKTHFWACLFDSFALLSLA